MHFGRSSSGSKYRPGALPLAVAVAVLTFNAATLIQLFVYAYPLKRVIAMSLALSMLPIILVAAWLIRTIYRKHLLRSFDYLKCPECGYGLQGLPDTNYCPECGEVYSPEVLRLAWAAKLGADPSANTPFDPLPHAARVPPTPSGRPAH